jgi:hypothetical protein
MSCDNAEGFLTVEDAAQLAGISHWTVRSWLQKGSLTRYKSASRTVVSRAEILERVKPMPKAEVSNLRGSMTVAAFSNGGDGVAARLDLCLVHLEADTDGRMAAEAVARGYGQYCGDFAVKDGVPSVRIEPGFESTMAYAAVVFAGMLGEQMKQWQLEQALL